MFGFNDMWTHIFQDAFFSAIAAIGFAAISTPPRNCFPVCALIAAIGHSLRYWLMDVQFGMGMHIVPATFAASFVIGSLAVFFSPVTKAPAETCLFPSLLPMIPGIYAYKTFGAMAKFVLSGNPEQSGYYFSQFAYNGFTCICILVCMAIGSTLPVFLFGRIAFRATRRKFL